MMMSKRKKEDPRWIERQSQGRLKTVEDDGTLVDQEGVAWVDRRALRGS